MTKTIIVTSFLLIINFICAQDEDAWVFLTDKENVVQSISNPILILTQEAIDRKNLHNVIIDERDVPVNEYYKAQIENATGITVLAKSKWFNCLFVRGTETDIRNLISLSFVDHLDFADNSLDIDSKRPSVISEPKHKPNNKFKVLENYDYGQAAEQIQQLKGDYLHQQGFSGQNMIIAVMDSGFRNVNTMGAFQRARDEGRILGGYDFVSRNDDVYVYTGHAHGTNTFSDIGGYIAGQFIGTAPDAKYYLFRTEDVSSEGPKEEALWVEAVERADSLGVDVINTSLGYAIGFDNPAYEYKTSDMDGQTAFITKGANIGFEKGMLFVSSAGNEGNNPNWGIITAPGDSPGTLTIGAVNSSGNYASFSSTGPTADNRIKPDVVARGASALIISSSNSVTYSSGTSFSSPIMAGVVACLWQALPDKTNGEIIQLIRESASLYNNPTNQLGNGIPDFQKIMETLSVHDETLDQNFKIYPNPVTENLFFESIHEKPFDIRIFTIDGKMIKSKTKQNIKNISLEDLSTGLYLLEIKMENKQYITKISKY